MDEKERWLNWINNLHKIDDIPNEPKGKDYGEIEIDSEILTFVENVVRDNGLEHNQEYIEMVSTAIMTVKEIKESKMPERLWQYITIILWNWFVQVPPSQRMSQMQVAFVLGMAFERSIDWEVTPD